MISKYNILSICSHGSQSITPVRSSPRTSSSHTKFSKELSSHDTCLQTVQQTYQGYPEIRQTGRRKEELYIYHNKTTDVSSKGNTLVVEGLIKFNSGKMKPTKFVFEANTATKNNKLRFIGENKQITRGRKAFTITGTLNENKSFITERFNYNYMTKNEKGNSTRLYGTLKK